MPPTKKIIVCCDGTWNDSDGTTNIPTNVAKLARCLEHEGRACDDPDRVIPQIVFYQSGIGAKAAGPIEEKFDGFIGRGINENVRQAYGFICNNYVKDDEIYIIGFSRGAYTARVIAALINDVGLLSKHALGYFYDIFKAWQEKNVAQKGQPGKPPNPSFQVMQDKLLKDPELGSFTSDVRVKVVAVWDTVGSLGIPVGEGPKIGPFQLPVDYLGSALRATRFFSWVPWTAKGTEAYAFVNTVISPCVENGIHALALDEHRAHFDPTIWEDPNPVFPDGTERKLTQCWFTGCHSHCGGGVEDNQELPNITLAWMMVQLKPFLSIDPNRINTTSEKDGPLISVLQKLHIRGEQSPHGNYMTDSKTGVYLLDPSSKRTPMQYRTQRVNPQTKKRYDEPLQNTNETIHQSVRVRFWNSKTLLASGQPYQPFALRPHWSPSDKHPFSWPYAKGGKIGPLKEAPFTSEEEEILNGWSNDQNMKNLKSVVLNNATT